MPSDIVSKKGNLLLNISVWGYGTIDEKELTVVEGIGDWMALNSVAIYGTRPWKVFGEGPASYGAALSAQGFNEGKGKPIHRRGSRFHGFQGRAHPQCLRPRKANGRCHHQITRERRQVFGP
jgi:alpha-L-fucosidase